MSNNFRLNPTSSSLHSVNTQSGSSGSSGLPGPQGPQGPQGPPGPQDSVFTVTKILYADTGPTVLVNNPYTYFYRTISLDCSIGTMFSLFIPASTDHMYYRMNFTNSQNTAVVRLYVTSQAHTFTHRIRTSKTDSLPPENTAYDIVVENGNGAGTIGSTVIEFAQVNEGRWIPLSQRSDLIDQYDPYNGTVLNPYYVTI